MTQLSISFNDARCLVWAYFHLVYCKEDTDFFIVYENTLVNVSVVFAWRNNVLIRITSII